MVVFDAFSSNIRDSASDKVAGGYEGDTDTTLSLRDLVEQDAKGKYYCPPSQLSVRAAVQADHENPRCAEIRALLQESFKAKLFEHTPLRRSLGTSGRTGSMSYPFKPPTNSRKHLCHTAHVAFETQPSAKLLTNFLAELFCSSLTLCAARGSLWSPSPGENRGW